MSISESKEYMRKYMRKYYWSTPERREKAKEISRRLIASPEGKLRNQQKVKEWRKSNPNKAHGKRTTATSTIYREIIIDYLIKRDGLICGFCKQSLENSKIHIDHIQAVQLGGKHTLDNVRLAHESCNTKAGLNVRRQIYGF